MVWVVSACVEVDSVCVRAYVLTLGMTSMSDVWFGECFFVGGTSMTGDIDITTVEAEAH